MNLITPLVFSLTVQLARSDIGSSIGSAFGSVASFGAAYAPPEFRGILGSAANLAAAKKKSQMGIIDFIQDGSDYPYICLCGTTEQLKQLNVNGVKIKPNQCPEDTSMGCRPPQIELAGAPMPVPAVPVPSK